MYRVGHRIGHRGSEIFYKIPVPIFSLHKLYLCSFFYSWYKNLFKIRKEFFPYSLLNALYAGHDFIHKNDTRTETGRSVQTVNDAILW